MNGYLQTFYLIFFIIYIKGQEHNAFSICVGFYLYYCQDRRVNGEEVTQFKLKRLKKKLQKLYIKKRKKKEYRHGENCI